MFYPGLPSPASLNLHNLKLNLDPRVLTLVIGRMNRDLVAYSSVANDTGVIYSDKVWEVWPRYPIKYENRQEVLMKIAIFSHVR